MAADDIFYGNSRKRIYISGGEGSFDVFQQDDADFNRNGRTYIVIRA